MFASIVGFDHYGQPYMLKTRSFLRETETSARDCE